MNLWRWLGLGLFLVVAVLFINSVRLPVAGAEDKGDKDKVADKGEKDKGEKDKGEKDKGVKDKGEKDKGEKDKGVKDKGEKDKGVKDKGEKDKGTKPEVKGGGEKLPFTAFNPDSKPFYQEQTTETVQNMKVQTQTVTQKQKQTFMILWTPKPKDKDGNYVVAQQIKGVKMEIDIGGNKIEYDSTKKNPKNPMTDFFEKLTDDKQVLTFHISEDLKVKKIEGRDEFIKNLSDINPQMKNLLNAILSDKALSKMAEPTWWAYPPNKGVVPADKKWDSTATLELGPIGTYTTKFDFTYKGDDKIGIKANLSYTAPGASEKAGLPFVIEEAKLSSSKGDGEAVYDKAAGRFKSTSLDMELKGDLKIAVGNQTTTVELTQTQKANSVTRDDNPWAADKK